MESRKLTLHIGLHKTGTSFIQSAILPKISSISLIRGWYSHRALLSSDLQKQIVISDEAISGHPWNGNYYGEFKKNICKIKKLYGNPKIIFGIRRQDKFLLSLYKQYLQEGGYKDMPEFFNIEDSGMVKHKDLMFEDRIQILKHEFKDVFIYSQETLKKNPGDFLDAFLSFLDVEEEIPVEKIQRQEVNKGVKTELQVNTLKQFNKFNALLERSKYMPTLYAKPLKILKATPRNICQDQLKKFRSKPFQFSADLEQYLKDYYHKDWERSKSFVCY